MHLRDVETLAQVLREHYSPAALDPGVPEATVVEDADGFRASSSRAASRRSRGAAWR